ncbi:MAG: DUF6515 family protein [Christiangramia sp.]|nr:DUF6515 family protein [Christiangramia sp.]
MKISVSFRIQYLALMVTMLLFLFPVHQVEAQRINRGGRAKMSRPAARPAPSRPARNVNTRNSQMPSRNVSRPSKRSINGGAVRTKNPKMPTRDVSRDKKLDRSEVKRPPATRPETGRQPVNNDRPKDRNPGDRNPGDRNPGNRNPGDRVNIDKGNNNVNINIDNSRDINIRNTQVRRSPRIYVRPPYIFGGFGFYTFRPYYYHPFRPFYWGPYWHPWGYFVTSLATTAIIISIENERYHYDQGTYYIEEDDGYRVVQAPIGAEVKELPPETETVQVSETTNNYYYGGAYYEKDGEVYKVVPPTAGTIVPNLPEGAEEVRIGEQTFVKYGETYYQPVQVDGKNMYEVVEVREEE